MAGAPEVPVTAGASWLRPKTSLHCVLSGVESDAHTWALIFLQGQLEYLGHRVHNLGPCVPPDEVVEACRSTDADLLILSTVNGHGHMDLTATLRALRNCGKTASLPVAIGGLLDVNAERSARRATELRDFPKTRVFDGPHPVDDFERYLATFAKPNTPASSL